MGIGAESIAFLAVNGDYWMREIDRHLSSIGFVIGDAQPVKRASSVASFQKKRRRFLFVDSYESGWVCLSEIGGMADRELARIISSGGREVYWLALHEAENAWGFEVYLNGSLQESILCPEWIFSDKEQENSYEGDATEEAFEKARSLGDFEPFCSYEQRAGGYLPEGVVEWVHLPYVRNPV